MKQSLIHLAGVSLKHKGLNPYGDPIYRVVWAPSRYYLVIGVWNDYQGKPRSDKENAAAGKDIGIVRRVEEARWVKLYPGINDWILEKWLPALEFAGTRESWEQQEKQGVSLGPYPSEGEFVGIHQFGFKPTISAIEQIIDMVEAGKRYSLQQKKDALVEEHNRQQREQDNRIEAVFKDSQGAFNNQPTNINPAKKTPDKVDFRVTADELDLPQQDGKFFQR